MSFFNMRMLPLGTLSIFFLLWSPSTSLMCLDSNGNEVDWYSTYKSPKIHSSSDWKIRAGLAHFYLDLHSPQWTLSDQPLNSSQQQIAQTLEQIYKPQGTLMFIMYNDESPEGLLRKGGGHTKGVVAFDETSGFWLIHSVPKFPPQKSEGYDYPRTGDIYGQTFLCVSLPFKELGTVGRQLQFNQPDIYDSSVPSQFIERFPILKQVIAQEPPTGPPWSSVQKISSVGNQAFISFAKANNFHADLYDALVAPTLKKNILVETWLREAGTELSSNCSADYKVLKINSVSLPNGVEFQESKDHAKWAVTTSNVDSQPGPLGKDQYVVQMSSSTDNYVCVGDINRMVSQFRRGGGTLCIRHTGMWKAYSGAVGSFVPCH